MAIILFTDFGSNDLYVGQVELAIARVAPEARVVHLLHDAPAFGVEPAAHLLAALAAQAPAHSVILAVVDPGVGTARRAAVVRADDRWYVGPDNGLLSIVAARAARVEVWHVRETPAHASPTFHGRDVFAPLAAAIHLSGLPPAELAASAQLDVRLPAADLPRVIYLDHYGNAFTGMRAARVGYTATLRVADRALERARTFGAVAPGAAFWYVNSQGLVEIAVSGGSARVVLGLELGTPVELR